MLPQSSTGSPLNAVAGGVRVAVRLAPRARADRIDAVAARVLKVWVTAPAVENQANEALLRLLAAAWRLPRRDLSIVAGRKSRSKLVHVAGDPADLLRRIGAAIDTPRTGAT